MPSRTLRGLASAIGLTLLLTSAVSAAPAPKPTLSLGVCKDPNSTSFFVSISWLNQSPSAGALHVDIDFRARQVTEPWGVDYIGPIPSESIANAVFVPTFIGENGPVDWDTYQSVSLEATGAFEDTSKAVRQPNGGWGTCPFG